MALVETSRNLGIRCVEFVLIKLRHDINLMLQKIELIEMPAMLRNDVRFCMLMLLMGSHNVPVAMRKN